jgi:hypothetical protein
LYRNSGKREVNAMSLSRWSLVTALAIWIVSPVFAADIGWQEAVARLAYERTRAETCVKALKAYGDPAAIKRGAIAYDEARAEYDAIIRGLTVALARKGEPTSLPDLQARTQRGFEAREVFCKSVQPLVPPNAGQKGPFTDIVGGVIGPVVDAVKVVWMRSKDDDALMRKTIENQLEATSWPPFSSISPSS